MSTQQVRTLHDQRAFVPMHQLEHSAPEVVDQPVTVQPGGPFPFEKGGYPPASYTAAHSYPPAFQEQPQRNSYWSPADFETVPPQYSAQYPGLSASDPASLVVPPIDQPARRGETICGIRRNRFILLLAAAGLVLLAIALGVGVGVGIGGNRSSG